MKRTERAKEILKLTVKKVFDPFYAGGAAEVGYFLLLSLVPASILLAQLTNVFTLSMDAIKGILTEYLPDNVVNVVLPLLNYRASGTFGVFLLILALWAGSRALFSLMRISNYAYKSQRKHRNPVLSYLRERARALFTIVAILVTLIFALYILIFGEVLVKLVFSYVNDFLGGTYSFSRLWYTVRWVIAFLLYLFTVLAIYYTLPTKNPEISRMFVKGFWRTMWNIITGWWKSCRETIDMIMPGSVFASVGMLIATWFYSLYMKYISTMSHNFNILYGGLSSVVMLLIWFYVIAFVLILGIQFNASLLENKIKYGPFFKRKERPKKKDKADDVTPTP